LTLGVVETTDFAIGGPDTITSLSGNDLVFGGHESDVIDAGHGANVVFGDDGAVTYDLDNNSADIDLIESTSTLAGGGADDLSSGDGTDVVIGGRFGDTIDAGDGSNIILGDSGQIDDAAVDAPQFTGLPMTIVSITTVEPDDGGGDDITSGGGSDILLGGLSFDPGAGPADVIRSGAGADIVIGDAGMLVFDDEPLAGPESSAATLDLVISTDPTIGGTDYIYAGSDNDFVIGGTGADVIYGDRLSETMPDDQYGEPDSDLIFGDHGMVAGIIDANGIGQHAASFSYTAIFTQLADAGGDDLIYAGSGCTTNDPGNQETDNGHNIILGQQGSDTIYGGDGNDDIYGGHNVPDGYDNDVSLADNRGDFIDGGAGADVILGDNGSILRTGSDLGPRFRALDGTVIYDLDDDITPLGGFAGNPANVERRIIVLYDHDNSVENEGNSGNDVIAGGADDDVIFGQLGDDQIHGDGLLNGAGGKDIGVTVTSGIDAAVVRYSWDVNSLFYASRAFDLSASPALDLTGVVAGDLLTVGQETFTIVGIDLEHSILTVDRNISSSNTGGEWSIHSNLKTLLLTVVGSDIGGDDYIEGNGGNDMIRGGLGQDDIIGGSSSLFSLDTPAQRPDGQDAIFGGNGDVTARNDYGEQVMDDQGSPIDDALRHARDADMIIGDNGKVFRLVGIDGEDSGSLLTFNYDNYSDQLRIVVRAAHLLDYTPGGSDYDAGSALNDIGAADTVRGESGDDFIYGQVGNDVLYGDAQDDDLIGGWGRDWISGGTGRDGVLGDDGRIYTSRNGTDYGEPLYGINPLDEVDESIRTAGGIQTAIIHPDGALKKSVNLTPFNVDPNTAAQDPLYDPQLADDIIYGGLGGDFLHGGPGDDAISGAEALAGYYSSPSNPGDVLGWSNQAKHNRSAEFAAYNEYDPLRTILVDGLGVFTTDGTGHEFLLNFKASEGPLDTHSPGTGYGPVATDGDDVLFGDLGNDWLVGGTGCDRGYGGWGDDLINMDDNHDSTAATADPRANNVPDTHPSYEDKAYGGAGRDILIANTGGDRLIDWAGEFNSYLVPFSAFGLATISRSLQPQLMEFLYAMSAADGADATRSADTGADSARNGEPEGEIGLVKQQDPAWHGQTGAPTDVQPGNVPGGARDVLRSATFNDGQADGFTPDTGLWTVESGRYQVAPEVLGADAVSVFYVDAYRPIYFEMRATINAGKPTAGLKSNAYLIFDYQSPTDFKFAGINISTDKLQMGHRDQSGWHVDVQTPAQLKPETDYNLLLAVNGVTATLVVNNEEVFHHVFSPRVIDGYSYGLNTGMVGLGANNSVARIDNVAVQVLPPEYTFDTDEDFEDDLFDLAFGSQNGLWAVVGGRYEGAPEAAAAVSLVDLGLEGGLSANSLLELTATIGTQGRAGIVFDYYGPDNYKFVVLDVHSDLLVIGHSTDRDGITTDAVVGGSFEAAVDYDLAVTLKGLTVSVAVDGDVLAGYIYNGVIVDGGFGLIGFDAALSCDAVNVKTDDSAFRDSDDGMNVVASDAPDAHTAAASDLTTEQLDPIVVEAKRRWIESGLVDEDMLELLNSVNFQIADLGGLTLATTVGTTVYIDVDAAGHGWFVDPTPGEDEEFAWSQDLATLIAAGSSPAAGRIDLLTVVMHELGHVMGIGHSVSDTADSDLMSAALSTSVRLLPSELPTVGRDSDVVGDSLS
jgi:Ca2+-binding RTX toxin-like protein